MSYRVIDPKFYYYIFFEQSVLNTVHLGRQSMDLFASQLWRDWAPVGSGLRPVLAIDRDPRTAILSPSSGTYICVVSVKVWEKNV